MVQFLKRFVILYTITVISCAQGSELLKPPFANKEEVIFHEHGNERKDLFHWLKNRDNPEVITYLNAENDYTYRAMASTLSLQNKLAAEFKNRIKENDSTVAYRKGNYYYYTRYEKNKTYPIYCRKKQHLNNPEEIILDVNALAKDHDYYDIANLKISPDESILAFAEDTQGRRKYRIRFKDLKSGQILQDHIVDATESMEWANDSISLFYAKQDPVTLRSDKIFKHQLHASTPNDKLVYEEKDDTFNVEIFKTKSNQYLMIGSFHKDTTEFQIADANKPDEPFRLFSKRHAGREYYIEHHNHTFIIRTNDQAPNFKVMQCDLNNTAFHHWKPLLPYDPNRYLENIEVYNDFMALEERKQGLVQFKIHPFNGGKPYFITFDEPDYEASLIDLPEMSSQEVRFSFSSLKTPNAIYDFNIQNKQRVLKKQDEVLGGFDSKHYQTERLFAQARDGTQIPVSIVYRKDAFKPHQNPLLLNGYGSYGISWDVTFNPYAISLLDRGFVYAIAHVRGGSELGRQWYQEGKLLKKKNTFTDFIDAAKFLESSGYAAKHKLYAQGGSAGGLLMGAVLNLEPQLFNGVIAQVPFVDVMNTMMDPSIPLTTSEYAEWGNPNDKTYYDYILSYSPYDNIKPTHYPHLLVLAGFHDSQVQYWEAAKWVAKLRATKTDENLLLLKTKMNAGHSGATGRYERYKDKAFEYAFLLNLERMG